MLQITEDTPPDMLAGAMDLAVHLPTGRAVKMSVERSTPMMDLLVQITTNHQLQLSNYTLQALGMAPSSEHSDKILPYKPNTPIGTLDTQHIKVMPKSRTLPVPKSVAPGHQPFESTFRLKVHLPRNQLYVTRVSRSVLLEDIMKKVCEEKKLDPMKYELKHPANLDEALDPKLTLSDYQITEIYVVLKGTVSLNQAFSTSDIMALRKEEERKQMHNKTGGGVLNLIFRRGKSSMGSGSISSDARSISPTQSDDSRSVTPPGVQQQILTPPKKDPPPDRPKPPQRKRRPAPKPPQQPENSRENPEESRRNSEESRRNSEEGRRNSEEGRRNSEEGRRNSEDPRRISEEKPPSTVSEVSELQSRRLDNGLVICHSRNSSDSSGYHEASVLSEHCNTSLPRRPKSAFVGSGDMEKMSKLHSHSTTNLSKMSSHSKSTTSLGITGRKKKAAPPPPPALRASNPAINLETPSPVVASPSASTQEAPPRTSQESPSTPSNPLPLPRSKLRAPPTPHTRIDVVPDIIEDIEENSDVILKKISSKVNLSKVDNDSIIKDVLKEVISFEERQNDEKPAILEKTHTEAPPAEDGGSKELDERNAYQNNENGLKLEPASNIPPCVGEIKGVESQTSCVPPSLNEALLIPSEDSSTQTCEDANYSGDSNEFLKNPPSDTDKNLPEIVAVIPKTPKEKKVVSPHKFDSMGKKRLQTLSSFIGTEEDTKTVYNRQSDTSSSPRTSVTSALGNFNFIDDFSDLDGSVFSGSVSSIKNFSISNEVYNQLLGMHNFEDIAMDKNQSINSLRSLRSLYGFSSGNGMKKWKNTEDLDSSLTSLGPESRWVTESLTSHPALDSLPSITSTSNILEDVSENEVKPFGSTDSGIAQENLERDPEDFRPITPPPPPAFFDEPLVFSTNILEEQQKKQFPLPALPQTIEEAKVQTVVDAKVLKERVLPENNTASKTKDSKKEERLIETVATTENNDKDKEITEIDWQYQLPSPPKAFRDCSPVNLPDGATSESHSVTNFKDSVVTSPELFEKLKSIEDSQSEKGTITSDLTSVISEEDRTPLMNTLSLENLERRKSLVYNRELATSLKMGDVETNRGDSETFSSSLTKFEDTFTEMQKSSQQKQVNEPKYVQKTATASHTHTLPNFKISTYDQPKQKIKVFEDDTIRSNTEVIRKMKRTNTETSTLGRSYVGHSMENISVRKNSIDEHSSYSNEDKEYTFFRPDNPPPRSFGPLSSVFRSESFSKDNWAPVKPVLRSKSHLTLDAFKYRTDRRDSADEEISRSNSFYDVSGLQSLGVMRMIQNKLNTPTSSMENLNVQDRHQKPFVKPELPKEQPQKSLPTETSKEPQKAIQPPETSQTSPETTQTSPETIPKSTEINPNSTETLAKPPEKTYKYRGPPSINMGTWSDRPKVPVSVKEDADYTLGNVSSKLIVNTTNNNITSNNSIEIKSSTPTTETNGIDNSVNIKVNGTEPTKQGNVVIKIGNINSQAPKTIDNHRFISHTTATGYRKPFTTLVKNQRPHSVAFDSDFDISRVPVVRSVELKKPFKDLGNTSVTQLNKEEPVSGLRNKFSGMYRSTETLSSKTYLNQANGVEEAKEAKPVPKMGSYKPMNAPVVRGFKTNNESNWATRLSWNPPGNFNTLPSKPRERDNFATNTQVAFSQSNLRRTDSSKMFVSDSTNMRTENNLSSRTIMPPPQMPKVLLKKTVVKPVEPVVDQRDQLLSAIRNFGGKKGLKAAKA